MEPTPQPQPQPGVPTAVPPKPVKVGVAGGRAKAPEAPPWNAPSRII